MSAPRFEAHGKQVFRDGEHFADAADTKAAQLIVETMKSSAGFARLHRAAEAYLRAASERTARIAAADLREALGGSSLVVGEQGPAIINPKHGGA
jgi:hypothetical protein